VIRFSLFGIPVGIHLSFLLIALFGIGVYRGIELAAWTLGVGVAVLFHEAGHAFTARSFGAGSISITLFAFGGYTTWAPGSRPIGPGKRFLIAAAGSAVGITLGAGVLFAQRSGVADVHGFLFVLLQSFVFAALVWGVLNWIPILPLDGGHMTQSILEIFLPGATALTVAKAISIVAAVGAGLASWFVLESPFLTMFIAIIAFSGLRTGPAEPQPATPKTEEIAPEPVDDPEVRRAEPPPDFPI